VSQSSSADAAPARAWLARRGAGPALAPRNWRVATRLIVLVAIPTVLGLTLTGLRVTDAARTAGAYGQVSRLAVLDQQVTGLAQEIGDERTGTAAFIADGRPAAGLVALHRQYAITDGRAATVRGLILRLGRGYPAQTRASAASVLASIAELPGLRTAATQSQAPALAAINGYSAAAAGLFPLNDGVADQSGNSVLIASVRALGALSRMADQASQQQAILGAALTEGRFGPGELAALTTAQAQQASDLASFRGSATSQESWALTGTLAGPVAGQARAVEQRAIAAPNGTLALGAQASQQWRAGMSGTVGWMRHSERQLAAWITAYAQAQRHSAIRSAIVTGGAALAILALVLLAAMFIARSVVRPLRRLEAAALELAGARLPAEVRALGAGGNPGPDLAVTPINVLSTDEIGQVARAFDQVHRQAVRLAEDEVRLRGSVSAVFASFFRRSHSLLERLLRLIDSLELGEDDPERLASLFQMDHLATRMRRNSDSALVLAGHEIPRRWTEPVTLVDVLRAAVSEIEQYDRVILNVQPGGSLGGGAAADTVHLLAELLENATMFSPRTTRVVVSAQPARGGGCLISIADAGVGLPEDRLGQLNWQLAHPPVADVAVTRRMGLYAVAHLAARHGIKVVLARRPAGGITAEVHLPDVLIWPDARPGGRPGQAGEALSAGARGPEFAVRPQLARPDAVPLPVGAPLPAPVQAAPSAVVVPEPAGPEPGGALPIFDSMESDYLQTRAQGLTSVGLPQRVPQASPVPSPVPGHVPGAADRASPQATTAESAQIALGRLASFQRGYLRARAAAGRDRDATQPARDD
jgi:signal transduction histidine kinase